MEDNYSSGDIHTDGGADRDGNDELHGPRPILNNYRNRPVMTTDLFFFYDIYTDLLVWQVAVLRGNACGIVLQHVAEPLVTEVTTVDTRLVLVQS